MFKPEMWTSRSWFQKVFQNVVGSGLIVWTGGLEQTVAQEMAKLCSKNI